MAISLVGIGDKIRASVINQIIKQVNGTALVGQIPASTSPGVTVSMNGAVTFASAAAVTLTGAFSTTYDNYRIVWDIPSQTAAADLQMRMANTGTPDTAGNYSYMRGFDNFNALSRTVNGASVASLWIMTAGASATQSNFGYMDLSGPALARYTSGLAQAVVHNPSPQMYTTSTQLYNSTTTAYDGFTLFPASGTISGTLRVYGYNNLA